MAQYIDKSALVAEIEKRIKELQDLFKEDEKKLDSFQKTAIHLCIEECKVVLNILDTLEVKEVGIAIPNIDELFEEDGIDPDSKDVKAFKECYYMALEKYKEKRGIV